MKKPVRFLLAVFLLVGTLTGCSFRVPFISGISDRFTDDPVENAVTFPSTFMLDEILTIPETEISSSTEATTERETELTTVETTIETTAPTESTFAETTYATEPNTDICCSVAFLGCGEGSFGEIQDQMYASGFYDRFPCLWDISEEYFVSNAGYELFLVIPEEGCSVTVLDRSMHPETGMPLYLSTLYTSGDNHPILLRGNMSDIFSNLEVMLIYWNGDNVTFSPSVSLRDGSLWISNDRVEDITPYDLLGITPEVD